MPRGHFLQFLDDIWDFSFKDLLAMCMAELQPREYTSFLNDMEKAKASITSITQVKLQHWNCLPWKLCGLAHYDGNVAKRIAAEVLSMTAAWPAAGKLHHPLTELYCKPGSLLRSQLEQFAITGDITLYKELQAKVAELAFIPIVERAIERGQMLCHCLLKQSKHRWL